MSDKHRSESRTFNAAVGDGRPLVSVIVPVRNESANIASCLASLDAQTFSDFEVILVDGESSDHTVELVSEFADHSGRRVRIVRNPDRTIPHALNRGAAEARGAFLIRIDGHATVNDTYLETLVGHLETGAWAGIGGRKVAIGTSRIGRAFGVAFASRAGAGGSTYHHGSQSAEVEHIPFGAYPRYVVRALHGWDEELLVNQDYEFDHRVRACGGRLLFDPQLVVHWRARETLRDVAYQYHRYGVGKAVVARKHARSVRPRQLAPPMLLVAASAMVVGAVGTRTLKPLIPYAGYALATTVAGVRAGRRANADARTSAAVPLVLATMHHAWGSGFIRGLVGRGRIWRAEDPFRRNPSAVAPEVTPSAG